MRITKAVRASLKEYVRRSSEYDPATMIISRDGSVSAAICPDKTCRHESGRRFLGWVDDMVREDGRLCPMC